MKRNINKFVILVTAVFALFLASCAPAKLTSYTMKLGYFPEDSDGLEAVAYTCTLEKNMFYFQETLHLGKVSSGAFIEAEIGTLEAHPYVLVILQNSNGDRRYSSDVWDLSKVKGNELRCEYWNCLSGGNPNGTYGINGVMINSLTEESMNRTLVFDFQSQPYYIFKVSKEVSSEFLYEIYTSSENVCVIGSNKFDDIVSYNKKKLLKYININPSYGYQSNPSSDWLYFDSSNNIIKNDDDYYILVFTTDYSENTAFSICLTDTAWIEEVSEFYNISETSASSWNSIKSADVGSKIYFVSKYTDTILRSYNPKEKEMKIEKDFPDKINSVVSYGKEIFVSTSSSIESNNSYTDHIYSYNTISGECHLLDTVESMKSIELFVSDCNLVYFEAVKSGYDYKYSLKSINFASKDSSSNKHEINCLNQASYVIPPVILFIENGKVYYAVTGEKSICSVEINADGSFGTKTEKLASENLNLKCPFVKNGKDILCVNTDITPKARLLKEKADSFDTTDSPVDITKIKTAIEFDGKLFTIKNFDYTIKDDKGKEYKVRVNGSSYTDEYTMKLMGLDIYNSTTLQKETAVMKKGYFSDTIGMSYNEENNSLETVIYGMGFAVQGNTLYLVGKNVPLIKDGKCLVSFIPVWSKASDWNTTLEGVTANILGFNDNTNMKFDSSFMIIEN